MPYLVELVIMFPINWHSNRKTLIFGPFSKFPYKKCKFGQKIKFSKSDAQNGSSAVHLVFNK